MKKKTKKLSLTRDTVTNLDAKALDDVAGAAYACQASHIICSIRATCVSCAATQYICA